jgi:hypothetical protein
MSTWVQSPNDDVAGRELQPVAKLAVIVEALRDRGLSFLREDDDLGEVEVAALRAGDTVYLLRRYVEDPAPGVAVHTVTAGDPTEQLVKLMRALGLGAADVLLPWDGRGWHESTTNLAV